MSNECLKEKNRDALHDYHEYTIPIYYQSLTMSECTIKNIKKKNRDALHEKNSKYFNK